MSDVRREKSGEVGVKEGVGLGDVSGWIARWS